MQNVLMEHPEVYEHLKNGGMSVQLELVNTFGCKPVDQAIEETANKDTLNSKGHEMIQFKPLSSRQMLPNGRVSLLLAKFEGNGPGKATRCFPCRFRTSKNKKDKQSTHAVV